MKITKEKINEVKSKIDTFLAAQKANGTDLIKLYETGNFPRSNKVKDLQKRFCFDIAYAVDLDFCALYAEFDCNDNHIETMLRRVTPKINKCY